MTTQQALERLDDMQGQIIHGKNTFGEIADVIRKLEADKEARMTAILAIIGGMVEGYPTSEVNFLQRLQALVDRDDQWRHKYQQAMETWAAQRA